jgi:hypothetical protein
VRAGPARDVADEEARSLVALDDRREALHVAMIPREGPPNKPLHPRTECKQKERGLIGLHWTHGIRSAKRESGSRDRVRWSG